MKDAILSTVHPSGGTLVGVRLERRQADVDEALAESFPASDPPGWNPGMARPAPTAGAPARTGVRQAWQQRPGAGTGRGGVIDVSRTSGSERTFVQAMTSLAGAAGIGLLVPFAILLLAMPIALAARGLLEAFQWIATALLR